MKSLRVRASTIPPPCVLLRQRGCADGHKPCLYLLREYVYMDGETEIRIPKRFHYDAASVPKLLHSLIGPFDLSDVAALVHDFLTRYQGFPPLGCVVPYRGYTRAEADDLFRRIMEELGVPEWRKRAGWMGVRIGGWNSWRKGKPASSVVA